MGCHHCFKMICLLSSGTRGTLTTEATAATTETTTATTGTAVTVETRTILTVEDRTTLVVDLALAGLHGVGNDLLRKVEVVAEVNDTLSSKGPVVPTPAESLLDVAAALETLHHLDELKVADLADEVVLGGKEVLLGNHDTLTEKVSIHKIAVLLGNDHRLQSNKEKNEKHTNKTKNNKTKTKKKNR